MKAKDLCRLLRLLSLSFHFISLNHSEQLQPNNLTISVSFVSVLGSHDIRRYVEGQRTGQ
jgi:hypothetical protein